MNQQVLESTKSQSRQQVLRLSAVLVLLSIIGVLFRLLFFGSEILSGGDQIWRLSVDVSTADSSETPSLKIFPPFDTSNVRVIQRNITHPNFRIRDSREGPGVRRSIYAIGSASGRQNLTTDFWLHLSQAPFTPTVKNIVNLTTERRETYLKDNHVLQVNSYMVQEMFKKILSRQQIQEKIIDDIYASLKLMAISTGKDELNVPLVLSKGKATILDQALAMVALSRAAGIPARLVTGIILKDDINPEPHYWVEVHQDNKWLAYDLHYGYQQSVPINYLPVRHNTTDIVQVFKGELGKVEFELEQEFDHPYLRKAQNDTYLSMLDFSRLSLDVRNELSILLLLPLGALITAVSRHLVGMRSYGVFTPTLLALAVVYTNVITMLTILIVVCSLAILGRSFFPPSITRIPRLSIIFTLVAVIIVFSVSMMEYFGLNQGGKVVLLPVIILTGLADRIYRTVEDKGVEVAMRRLIWTIIIALLCLPVMQFETLGHLILKYPEIHFTTLAMFMMISCYKGKQLLNLPLVKLLAEPGNTKVSSKKGSDAD